MSVGGGAEGEREAGSPLSKESGGGGGGARSQEPGIMSPGIMT